MEFRIEKSGILIGRFQVVFWGHAFPYEDKISFKYNKSRKVREQSNLCNVFKWKLMFFIIEIRLFFKDDPK